MGALALVSFIYSAAFYFWEVYELYFPQEHKLTPSVIKADQRVQKLFGGNRKPEQKKMAKWLRDSHFLEQNSSYNISLQTKNEPI